MSHSVSRIGQMSGREIAWRARTAARTAVDRVRVAIRPPTWKRGDLARRLVSGSPLDGARSALAKGRWQEAHLELAHHFAAAPARFVIAPTMRASVAERIRREFPDRASEAAASAGRIVAGQFDLLGYRGLRFDEPTQRTPKVSAIDWHYDPVHGRRPPRVFWADVPYLDPVCGDHKIIWELNRHQHWLVLGRAFWLTGNDQYRRSCIDELESWLEANPPLVGINWASMLELSLRSISWIWALNFFADSAAADESPWIVDLLLGVDLQLAHVERNLSYYFSPNTHLLGEALALYVAGRTLPELASAERRASTGRQVLVNEIDNQIAPDGGHCERSTHYHKYALDFYLLALAIARITNDPIAAAFERAAARLAFAARVIANDRGRLPHFGDDDGGALMPIAGRSPDDIRDSLAVAAGLVNRPDIRVGHTPEEAVWLLSHPKLSAALDASRTAPPANALVSTSLPSTGYYVSRSPAGDHLVIDGGPHGYLNGGHAHSDALSLTFSRHGAPLLIDPGTACYTTDRALRDRFRSTALHNTVVIDDAPQSVPAGAFHWARTASASVLRWRTNAGFDYFEGTHDGYAPLRHRRHVLALHDDLLVVADLVTGPGSHHVSAHWHLDPQWDVQILGRRALFLCDGERAELVVPAGILDAVCGDSARGLGWHSPEYGRVEPTTTIRVTQTAATPLWIVSVFGWDTDNAIAEVDAVPVWAEAGVLSHATAIRIARRESIDCCVIAEPATDAAVTWRVGEIETDARVLFCRMDETLQISRLALVDGSAVRAGRRGLHLQLPQATSDLHLDVTAFGTPDRTAAVQARLSGPVFGARLVINGREQPIALERRAMPRRLHG